MFTIPPSPYRKRRPRPRIVPSTPPPPTTLTLVSATIAFDGGADAVVELVFSNSESDPIVDLEAAVGTNWTAVINGHSFGGNNPLEQSAYNTVQLSMGNTGDAEGPNVISFAADPADIVTDSGLMLAAFVDRALE